MIGWPQFFGLKYYEAMGLREIGQKTNNNFGKATFPDFSIPNTYSIFIVLVSTFKHWFIFYTSVQCPLSTADLWLYRTLYKGDHQGHRVGRIWLDFEQDRLVDGENDGTFYACFYCRSSWNVIKTQRKAKASIASLALKTSDLILAMTPWHQQPRTRQSGSQCFSI